jgi:two-component system invasion response regulator UvrY
MEPIRVAIADDHEIVRLAIRRLVDAQPGMAFAGEAWDGRGAIDLLRDRRVDVLILDLLMPGQGGLDCMGMLRAKAPGVGLLVLTTCPARRYAATVYRQGAHGYLSKDCDPQEIVLAIQSIAQGRRYVSAEAMQCLVEAQVEGPPRLPHEHLTTRELQILLHLGRGAGSAQVARDLSLSPRTVSTYRSLLLRKLGLHSDSELTRYALKHGLLD